MKSLFVFREKHNLHWFFYRGLGLPTFADFPKEMPLIMDAAAQYHACSIENWYEDFQDVTLRTNIVKIPQNVLSYFRADEMILPSECYAAQAENGDWSEDEDEDAVQVSVYGALWWCSNDSNSALFSSSLPFRSSATL